MTRHSHENLSFTVRIWLFKIIILLQSAANILTLITLAQFSAWQRCFSTGTGGRRAASFLTATLHVLKYAFWCNRERHPRECEFAIIFRDFLATSLWSRSWDEVLQTTSVDRRLVISPKRVLGKGIAVWWKSRVNAAFVGEYCVAGIVDWWGLFTIQLAGELLQRW